jgi:hypothetical protein
MIWQCLCVCPRHLPADLWCLPAYGPVCTALQVNRRQAHAEAVAAEYAALQQEHTNLENELLEAKSQVHLLQAEVRMPRACLGKTHSPLSLRIQLGHHSRHRGFVWDVGCYHILLVGFWKIYSAADTFMFHLLCAAACVPG